MNTVCNSVILKASEKIQEERKNLPKISKYNLEEKEKRAAELFDGKTIFESFK